MIALLPVILLQADSTAMRHSQDSATPVVTVVRVDRAPVVDGRLDDAAWASAPPATGLVQRDPDEGRPASESTEVRLVYDGAALYIGARLYDSHPQAITRRLARRDFVTPSDEFRVYLDTYHDHRTTALFAVSPAGV